MAEELSIAGPTAAANPSHIAGAVAEVGNECEWQCFPYHQLFPTPLNMCYSSQGSASMKVNVEKSFSETVSNFASQLSNSSPETIPVQNSELGCSAAKPTACVMILLRVV